VVGATALVIGSEANLAANTEFSIANYSQSDYVARNDEAFSGGTSREVQVVTQEDHDELLTQLTDKMESAAKDTLGSEIPSEKKLLTESVKSEVAQETYSQEVDEESTQVSLSLKLKSSGLVYDEALMHRLIENLVKGQVPADYEYNSQDSLVEFSLKELMADGRAVFVAKVSVNLVSQLDIDEIKNNLVGKLPFIGKSYLESLPGVAGTQITISPKLPAKILTFPRVVDNITVETEVK
jgi:hypothetical protein